MNNRTLRAFAVAVALVLVASAVGTVRAQSDISSSCYGAVASGIASTWPWAHNDKAAFPPSPGALPLWIQDFGASVGIYSVRDLQVRFCSE